MKLRSPMLSERIKEAKLRPDYPYPSSERDNELAKEQNVKAILEWQRSLRMSLVKNEGDK